MQKKHLLIKPILIYYFMKLKKYYKMKIKEKHFTLFSLTVCLVLTLLIVSLEYKSNSNEKNNRGKISGAYEALNFWSMQRIYPFNSIPDKKYYLEYSKLKEDKNLSRLQQSNVNPWYSIGPHNTGGRTLSLAFNRQNTNTIYAGSASGGLWRSYTGGVGVKAWNYVRTGFPVTSVSSIAIVPDDSNTIYIGTGEVYNYQSAGTGAAFRSTRGSYGIGILKSTDAGNTWIKSLDWSLNESRGVWAIKINPLNFNTVWAATTEGIFRSYDAGNSWVQVLNVIMGTDLLINAADTNIIVSAHGNFASDGFGIYRSTDAGKTWNKITSGLPTQFKGKIQLAASVSEPDKYYASIGNGFSDSDGATWLAFSSNSGETWSVVSQTDYSRFQGWYSHDVAVNPLNSSEVIAIGIEVWKSTNAGNTLIRKSNGGVQLGRTPIGGPEGSPSFVHSDVHDVVYNPLNPNIIYFAGDGGVYRSTDGGETFRDCNGSYQTTQFYSGFSNSFQDSLFALGGLQDNSTIIYDGSLAWTRAIGGDGSWTAINPTNDNIVYGSWQFLSIMKSTDKGKNFNNFVAPPSSSITSFIAPYVISGDGLTLYAGRDKVYKSTNSGSSWSATNGGSPLDGNPVFTMAVSPELGNVLYAATAPYRKRSGLFLTADGGNTWKNVTNNLPDRYITDIAFEPGNPETAYVTIGGFGTSHLFKTTDIGANWADIGIGLPDVPTSAVVLELDYPNNIYVGNDLGVFASTDGGLNWFDFNQGLPDAVLVMDLTISSVNKKLRVATHGNGVFERPLIENIVVKVNTENQKPFDFYLSQNYPNPFNPATKINFIVPENSKGKSSKVILAVYDALGKKIETLVNEEKTAGSYEVQFDAKNYSSGIYFYNLTVGSFSITKKMILMR